MAEMISPTDLLDFVINREQTSASFFTGMAERTGDSILKGTFGSLAQRSTEHEILLIHLRSLDPELWS